MGRFDDPKATWRILSEQERKALAAVADRNMVVTPQNLGRLLGVSWQAATRTARKLKGFGLVRIESRTKMTWYEVTGQGEACLAAGRADALDSSQEMP